jgi:hypothetical protein
MYPGSGMGKKSGSGIRNEQSRSYLRELRNNILVKYLNILMRIQDPGWKKFGSGINVPVVAGFFTGFQIRIKVKRGSGSALR